MSRPEEPTTLRELLDLVIEEGHGGTISIPAAAGILVPGTPQSTAYDWAEAGDIPWIQVGRNKLVPVAQLLRVLGFDPDRIVHNRPPNTPDDDARPLEVLAGDPDGHDTHAA